MSNKIKTKYGSATFDEKRGYRITSRKEKNHKQFVHILVWKEHYGEIPSNAYVIFKDGNKKNFDISNLELKYRQKTFKTEFGLAGIGKNGYIVIVSGKYHSKTLHRLIWEKHNGGIPKGYQVHHIDGNKLNNDISNLQLLSAEEHTTFHMEKDNPNKGRKVPLKNRLNMSKHQNKTGYYRVSIKKYYGSPTEKYGYRYCYTDENGKQQQITAIDIPKLEKKVKAKGLEWVKLDD